MLKLELSFANMGQTDKVQIPLPREMSHLWAGSGVTARVVDATTLVELGAQPGAVAMLTAACKYECGQGRKIEAIKYVRQATNTGLKEAKDWVEANCY